MLKNCLSDYRGRGRLYYEVCRKEGRHGKSQHLGRGKKKGKRKKPLGCVWRMHLFCKCPIFPKTCINTASLCCILTEQLDLGRKLDMSSLRVALRESLRKPCLWKGTGMPTNPGPVPWRGQVRLLSLEIIKDCDKMLTGGWWALMLASDKLT